MIKFGHPLQNTKEVPIEAILFAYLMYVISGSEKISPADSVIHLRNRYLKKLLVYNLYNSIVHWQENNMIPFKELSLTLINVNTMKL